MRVHRLQPRQPALGPLHGRLIVTITQVNVSGAAFSIVVLGLPLKLQPGQSSTFGVTFIPSGIGNVTGSLSIVSNAQHSPFTIALNANAVGSPTPQLSVTPSSLNFGNVAMGAKSSQVVALTNTGNANVIVTQVTVAGAGFSVSGPTLPLTLMPEELVSFSVFYVPAAPGAASGTATVVSNAGGSPILMPLTASGGQPGLTVNPPIVATGSVNVGSSNTQTVTITNSGTATLNVTQANVTGSGFTIIGLALPLTLAVGQSSSFHVKFVPAGAGNVTGGVSLVSNGSDSLAAISLSGNGVAPIAHSVTLAWDPSTSTISGYHVYRGGGSGGPYTKVDSSLIGGLTWTDDTVTAGQAYFYVVIAVDTSGVESVFSNEIGITAPNP